MTPIGKDPHRGSGGCPPGRHSLELTGKELRA